MMRIYSIVKRADTPCYGCGRVALREKERPTDKQKPSEARNVLKLVSFAGYCALWEGLRYN